MRYSRIPRSAKVVACGLLAAGGLLFYLAVKNVHPIRVQQNVCELGAMAPGQTKTASYRLSNDGSSTVRLVGSCIHCGENGCADKPPITSPLDIPPGETRVLELLFRANAPGPFEYSFQVYSDCPRQNTIELTIRGVTSGETSANVEKTASAH